MQFKIPRNTFRMLFAHFLYLCYCCKGKEAVRFKIHRKMMFDIRRNALCRFFRILLAHFPRYGCCCKVYYISNRKIEKRYEINNWNLFINNKFIPITQDDLHEMREKYINSCYHHKHYCFKNAGEKCNHLRCIHYENTKWKGLVKHPVLHLLVLNFDVAKEICKDVIAVKELNIYNNKNWFYDDDSPLDFIFKVIVNQVVKTSTGLKYTKNSLDNRINNICLVLEDFPREYTTNFQDEEKFILEKILRLHHNYKVPLMYHVR